MAVIVLGLALLKFREIIARRITVWDVACRPSPTARRTARPEPHDTPFIMPFIFCWRGAVRSHYQSLREIGPPITACRTSTRLHWAGVGAYNLYVVFLPTRRCRLLPTGNKKLRQPQKFLVASRRLVPIYVGLYWLDLA